MKKRLSELLQPDITGVKKKLVMAEEDTADDLYLAELHLNAIATLDECLNRRFVIDEPAFLMAKDISFALAAFKYENPVELLIPSHIDKEIKKIRFEPGF